MGKENKSEQVEIKAGQRMIFSKNWSSEPFEFVAKYAVDHKVDAAVQCHLNRVQIQMEAQIQDF